MAIVTACAGATSSVRAVDFGKWPTPKLSFLTWFPADNICCAGGARSLAR
jgi:hypothetical protein